VEFHGAFLRSDAAKVDGPGSLGFRKSKGVEIMGALNEVIESTELPVHCRRCGWTEQRTVMWLSAHRDMNCPACCSVIVLNTSERRREISQLRRQLAALHDHLSDLIPLAGHLLNGMPTPVRTPAPDLALASAYRKNRSGRGGQVRSSSGNARRSGAAQAMLPYWLHKHQC
jgi:hypothetical protein